MGEKVEKREEKERELGGGTRGDGDWREDTRGETEEKRERTSSRS